MPYRWIDPESILDYEGVEVYEHYWDNMEDDVDPHKFDLWYWNNDTEDPNVVFDIREYADLVGIEPIFPNYESILKALIDDGYLTKDGISRISPIKEPEDVLTLHLPFEV